MITINLLPQEYRIEEKKAVKVPVMPLLIGAAVLFMALTAYFYMDFVLAKGQLEKVNKEWLFIQPQSQRLTQLEQEVTTKLGPENVFLNRFVTTDKSLTGILSWVNEFLPASTWLIEFKLERIGEGSRLYLKGLTLPTKEKSSIESIESYLHELKKKMPDANLSLTTSRFKIKEVELMQFIATFEWGVLTNAKP